MTDLDSNVLRDALTYVDRWLAFRRELRNIPGLVVAVRSGEETMLSRAYGFAQLEPAVPMSPRHIFRIASHSKTFTATAVMQLVEQGRLRLDDRAAVYIPWLSSHVTIRQLLNHVGGVIRDGIDADFWRVEQPFPDVAALRTLEPDSAILPENQTFKYSNIGFGLLGLVVEAASGQSYNSYVREHIVERLGLADTGPEYDPALAQRMATGYTAARLGVARRAIAPGIDTRALSAATGFYATADDLCRYAAAHWFGDDTLISDASKREMQHPAWQVEYSEDAYGLGFSIQPIGTRQMVGHGGGFPGQSTRTLIDPVQRLVVVLFSNTSASDGLAAPLATEIVRIIDFAHDTATAHRSDAPPTVPLETFVGRFANTQGVLDVTAFGRSLLAIYPENDSPVRFATELEVVDANSLRAVKTGGYGFPGELVRYERDQAGGILRIVAGGVSSYPEDIFRQRYG